ncbi:MAG TPA: Uma2 family endonuclease [Bryobacteraceae bacterium]|jgi:Uma2 family endonuclease|nr:Uma2 family endonuclease [Bryobacteraceae bacterium]
MAVGTQVSVEEYLHTSYRPDCDYVDGEVLERNLGEKDHGSTQREILFYLGNRYPGLRRRLLPEQRVQVKTTRFRIPDVCILAEKCAR